MTSIRSHFQDTRREVEKRPTFSYVITISSASSNGNSNSANTKIGTFS